MRWLGVWIPDVRITCELQRCLHETMHEECDLSQHKSASIRLAQKCVLGMRHCPQQAGSPKKKRSSMVWANAEEWHCSALIAKAGASGNVSSRASAIAGKLSGQGSGEEDNAYSNRPSHEAFVKAQVSFIQIMERDSKSRTLQSLSARKCSKCGTR